MLVLRLWCLNASFFFFFFAIGYDVYLVGGCVRDLILQRTPKDFDIITSAELKEVGLTFVLHCHSVDVLTNFLNLILFAT